MAHHKFNNAYDYDMSTIGECDGINPPYQNATIDDYEDFLDDYPVSDDLINSSPSLSYPDAQSTVYQGQSYDEIEDYGDDSYDIPQDSYFPRGTNTPLRRYFTASRVSWPNVAEYNSRPLAPFTQQSSNTYNNHQRQLQYQQPPPHVNAGPPTTTSHEHHQHLELAASSRGSHPRNTHGIRLRPVSDLPDMYRGLFKFGIFNAVQSTCFNDVVYTNQNMVISAPTGSGKTVLFELSIIRMLTEARNTGQTLKCVYMAPTKALCSERYRDWSTKFDPLGVKCCELTGDTVHFGKGVWGDARNASIIITTGEKWDSLTRNWRDHGQTLSQIQLFLVDEVHILNESRGSTLEVVVSRMKTRGSAVRFVLVSATVPNIDDIASWIGSQDNSARPAEIFEFGEAYRPCKLTRIVIGVSRGKSQNDFAFNKTLDFKLFDALQQHSVGKPILVFCSTRRGVFTTAEHLMKDYIEAEKSRKTLPWSHPPRIDQSFHDKRLMEFASFGIGVHHAGLTMDDRRATEDLYLKKTLRIIVATSTLAVGVNLPAHVVVIKGVQTFQNNASMEYSDLDVMQMLGRAGRPQFDKDGIAIILCELELENKYRTLVQGKTILESSLHKNLSEHLNSEIGLGTITDINSAKEWLRGSFLFQRIRKNPSHYALGKEDHQTWEERVDDLVTQSVSILQQTELIETPDAGDESGALTSTEYGDIMSKFYIRQSTMGLILTLPERPTLREILEMIAASEELSETKMRVSEKMGLNKLRKHNDIRFEIKKLDKTSDKVFLLIQAVLGGISLNNPEYKSADSQPQFEAFAIFRHISRIARIVVEVGVVKKLGGQVKHGLELVRCLTAKAWEDRPVVLRQIEQIGEKSLKVLAEHGITSLGNLGKQDSLRIETLLNRRAPFGLEVLTSVRELPQYYLNITEVSVSSNGGKAPVAIELSVECGLADGQTKAAKAKKAKGRGIDMTAVLTTTSDMDLLDFRRIPTKALTERKTFEITVELTRPSQSVMVLITSETIAGVKVDQVYKPKVSPKEYPTMDTRPPTTTDIDLAGLEDDPDFWNMYDNDDEKQVQVVPVRDLTKKKATHTNSQSSQDTHSTVLQPLDRSIPEHKKLPNGNYECNHPCKDKTKCRHLCCRDGLSEAPHPSKKQAATAAEKLKTAKSAPVTTGIKPAPTKDKMTAARKSTNRKLGDLEKLHKRTNVTTNLKLSEGQRLKLDSPDELKRKRKPLPEFRLELADLNDPRPSNAPCYETNDIEYDDDDLPEAQDITKATPSITERSSPSDTNYSNSDIDSLIRAVPLDEIEMKHFERPQGIFLKRKASEKYHEKPYRPETAMKRARLSASPPKRVRSTDNIDADNSSLVAASRTKSGNPIERLNPIDDVLFIEASDDDEPAFLHWEPPEFHAYDDALGAYNQLKPQIEADDDFSINSDYLGVLPATPELTAATSEDDTKDNSEILRIYETENLGSLELTNESINKNDDEFAELDAWLTSGAVEIV